MRRKSLGVALAAVAAVSPLSAQTWQAIGTPNNTGTGAYWNSFSDDVAGSNVCNAGAILTNTPALAATSCNAQAPVYLPLSPAPLATTDVFLGGTAGANPGSFRFAAGQYNFALIGRIAGTPSTTWGIVTESGMVISAATLVSGTQSISSTFAVWISQAQPAAGVGSIWTSTMQNGVTAPAVGAATSDNQQFAVFAKDGTASVTTDGIGAIISGSTYSTFYVGMEDNVNGGRGFTGTQTSATNISDRDYQDIIISVTPVPEPATVGLMGFGLLALAGIAKRRKA
ncbi:MAG: PEP-CTERM sorting domain-containing protein [Gemmatimonadaceae bacterium]|nr:PEP-CTERM sorting domain-containing protein [Gemmatimonadaceae bacterium]